LAEMAVFSKRGADISVGALGDNMHEVLYSEAQSGVVVTCTPGQEEALEDHFSENGVPFTKLGSVGSKADELTIDDLLSISTDEMFDIYDNVIEASMKQQRA